METEKRKVLIEGYFSGSTNLNSVHPTELPIPRNVTKLQIGRIGSSYIKDLRLIYRWEGRDFIPADPLKDFDKTYLINNNEVIPDVATVIVEDGRIFHDLTLFEANSVNMFRLDNYLEILRERNNGFNPVRLFFTREARQLFMNTPIEIYND